MLSLAEHGGLRLLRQLRAKLSSRRSRLVAELQVTFRQVQVLLNHVESRVSQDHLEAIDVSGVSPQILHGEGMPEEMRPHRSRDACLLRIGGQALENPGGTVPVFVMGGQGIPFVRHQEELMDELSAAFQVDLEHRALTSPIGTLRSLRPLP